MREEYKGFLIKTAKPTGGKAGKGRNKTTTLMVFDPDEGLLLKLFRYTLGDLQSYYSARVKAYDYIEQRLTQRPRHDEIRIHVPGTPDVPDIIRPGDWMVQTDEIGDVFSLVVKLSKHKKGKWDSHPDAESWTIHHIGLGYMDGRNVSAHDVCFINGIVAVNGELLPLRKLPHNKKIKINVCQKPEYIAEVPQKILALIKRMNVKEPPKQLSLFAGT